ncbi:MAG: PAS domain S-box protein [Polyangiaceae bacterium]|nr:PAS domain S-box protein [Polyangiaceae bacterium]
MTRVLVVDDVESNRYLLRAVFGGEGWTVDEARHGAEALLVARANPPDLVVSDLLMPVLDGFALLREWKADERLRSIPFVVYTATYTDPRDEALVRGLGADAFVVKPADPDAFVAVLRRTLAEVPRQGPTRAPSSDPGALDGQHRDAISRKLEAKLIQLERLERELGARNAQLASLLEAEPGAVARVGPAGEILQVNARGLELLEAGAASEILGRTLASFAAPGDVAAVAEGVRRALQGSAERVEHRVAGLKGTLTWVETQLSPLHEPERGGVGVRSALAVTRDVTAQRLALETEARERALSTSIVQSLPGIFYLFDEAGRFVRWNDRFEQVTGYTAAELAQLHPLDLFQGAEREVVAERIERALVEGEATVEAELVAKSGQRTPFFFTGVRSFLDGRAHVAGTGVDLSAHRQAEAALAAAHAWQHAILETAPIAIVSTDEWGTIQTFNPAAERLLGWAAAEVVGERTPVGFYEPAELARCASELALARGGPVSAGWEALAWRARAGAADEREWTFVRRDGERVPVRVGVAALRAAGSESGGFLLLATDLREQRREAESRRVQSAALAAAANPMMITDRHGKILWVNPAWERLTGWLAADAIGKSPRILKSGLQSPDFYAELWGTIQAGRVWRSELRNRRKDGSVYPEEETITPVVDAAGAVTHFIAVKQDITLRKREEEERWKLEEQLRVSERLNAVGRLAGGVAHDFNNVLSVIQSYAEVVVQDLPEGSPLREDVAEIRHAAERAAELTQQLLAFGRRQVLRIESVDLNRVASNLEKLLRRLLGEDVELVFRLGPAIRPTRADPSQIEQILMNLAVNARDAMPGGGRLTVETSNMVLDAEYCAAHFGVDPGAYVLLAVTDTGVGMDEATRSQIFEPYFTTKPKGKGTGLGLATVHGIVEQSGGHVWVYSELGQGTTFKVYLPQHADGLAELPSDRPRPPRRTGTETILIAEDERAVRSIVERVLTSAGYRVLVGTDGADALEVARRYPDPIDLVVTDVVMPRLSGRELVERLKELRPAARALFMSGYADDAIGYHGILEPGVRFIGKPFTLDAFLREVREALDAAD